MRFRGVITPEQQICYEMWLGYSDIYKCLEHPLSLTHTQSDIDTDTHMKLCRCRSVRPAKPTDGLQYFRLRLGRLS